MIRQQRFTINKATTTKITLMFGKEEQTISTSRYKYMGKRKAENQQNRQQQNAAKQHK
jgi:hypothetical protein